MENEYESNQILKQILVSLDEIIDELTKYIDSNYDKPTKTVWHDAIETYIESLRSVDPVKISSQLQLHGLIEKQLDFKINVYKKIKNINNNNDRFFSLCDFLRSMLESLSSLIPGGGCIIELIDMLKILHKIEPV